MADLEKAMKEAQDVFTNSEKAYKAVTNSYVKELKETYANYQAWSECKDRYLVNVITRQKARIESLDAQLKSATLQIQKIQNSRANNVQPTPVALPTIVEEPEEPEEPEEADKAEKEELEAEEKPTLRRRVTGSTNNENESEDV